MSHRPPRDETEEVSCASDAQSSVHQSKSSSAASQRIHVCTDDVSGVWEDEAISVESDANPIESSTESSPGTVAAPTNPAVAGPNPRISRPKLGMEMHSDTSSSGGNAATGTGASYAGAPETTSKDGTTSKDASSKDGTSNNGSGSKDDGSKDGSTSNNGASKDSSKGDSKDSSKDGGSNQGDSKETSVASDEQKSRGASKQGDKARRPRKKRAERAFELREKIVAFAPKQVTIQITNIPVHYTTRTVQQLCASVGYNFEIGCVHMIHVPYERSEKGARGFFFACCATDDVGRTLIQALRDRVPEGGDRPLKGKYAAKQWGTQHFRGTKFPAGYEPIWAHPLLRELA